LKKLITFTRQNKIYSVTFVVLIAVIISAYWQGGNLPPHIPTLLTVEMRTAEDELGHILYDIGDGFIEEDSVSFNIRGSNNFRKTRVLIPGRDIEALRFDPMVREGDFDLRSMHFYNFIYQKSLIDADLKNTLRHYHQVDLTPVVPIKGASYIKGVSTGIDPHFTLHGVQIENRLSWVAFVTLCLSLLLLVITFLFIVAKLFFGKEKEVLFCFLLLYFSFPIQMPSIPSLILTASALILMFLLLKQYGAENVLLNTRLERYYKLLLEPGKVYTLLFIIVILAFILRIVNLNILDPYTDEYMHIMAAKDIYDTGTTNYARASLVTYLVALFYKIGNADTFYEYLYWGRVPGVIFSSLTVIPLFFLTRRISVPVALISSFLWATSPWAIGVAKTIREYAYYPLFIILASIALMKLYELILEFNKKYILKIILLSVALIAFTYYAFYVDTASTLRIWAIVFAGISVYYLLTNIENLRNIYHNNKILFSIIGVSVLVILWIMLNYRGGHVSIEGLVTTGYSFNVFFNIAEKGMPMHWWGAHNYTFIGLFLFTFALIYAQHKKENEYYIYFVIFFILLIFYTYFFDRYFRPRYIFYMLPYFIAIISLSLYVLFNMALKYREVWIRLLTTMTVVIFIFQIINYQNIIYPIISDRHGYIKTTNEHHDYLGSMIEFLENEISQDDHFITSIFSSVLLYHFNIEPIRISGYRYDSETRFNKVERIINDNDQGFMVLDWRRNGHFTEGYPLEGNFYIGTTDVEVVQNEDGIQIYRWKK